MLEDTEGMVHSANSKGGRVWSGVMGAGEGRKGRLGTDQEEPNMVELELTVRAMGTP